MVVISVYRSVNPIGASVTRIHICSKDYVHLTRKYYFNNLYVLNHSCLILSPSEMIYSAFQNTTVDTYNTNSSFYVRQRQLFLMI